MNVFCLLWVPMFYLFWRSVAGGDGPTGGVWALIMGSIAAFVQFFIGPLVDPGEFGFYRWLSGCIDIVTLPVLLPILVYLFLVVLKITTGTAEFASFALIWLIPGAVFKALSWISLSDPNYLVLVPILWTTIAVGISFFINIIQKGRWFMIILAILGIFVVPLAATSSYWAFYAQKSTLGFLFLAAAAAPMLVSIVLSYVETV